MTAPRATIRELRLTLRQKEVLFLVAEAMTYGEIGAALNISPATVRVHVNAIVQQLPPDPHTSVLRSLRRWLETVPRTELADATPGKSV